MSKMELLKDENGAEQFRLIDYPMHYFAAIQFRNQSNIDVKLASIGLTPMEWRILATLHYREPSTVNEIADTTVMDRFKVSRALKLLSDKGYVTEDQTGADKRRRRSKLTRSGKNAYEQAYGIMRKVYLQNFEGLTEEQFDLLMKMLRTIKDNVFRAEAY